MDYTVIVFIGLGLFLIILGIYSFSMVRKINKDQKALNEALKREEFLKREEYNKLMSK